MAFNNRVTTEELDSMSEDMITLAQRYWDKGDYESYKKLLVAAEETCYMYHGNKYPHKLVEDIIRDSH